VKIGSRPIPIEVIISSKILYLFVSMGNAFMLVINMGGIRNRTIKLPRAVLTKSILSKDSPLIEANAIYNAAKRGAAKRYDTETGVIRCNFPVESRKVLYQINIL
jgi:hypothetical protein